MMGSASWNPVGAWACGALLGVPTSSTSRSGGAGSTSAQKSSDPQDDEQRPGVVAPQEPAQRRAPLLGLVRHLVAGPGVDHLLLRLVQDRGQLLHLARLLEILERLQPPGLLGRVQAAVPGEHDRLDGGVERPHLPEGLDAVHAGHLQVQDRDVDVAVLAHPADGLLAVVHVDHVVAAGAQPFGQGGAEALLVVDEKDLGHVSSSSFRRGTRPCMIWRESSSKKSLSLRMPTVSPSRVTSSDSVWWARNMGMASERGARSWMLTVTEVHTSPDHHVPGALAHVHEVAGEEVQHAHGRSPACRPLTPARSKSVLRRPGLLLGEQGPQEREVVELADDRPGRLRTRMARWGCRPGGSFSCDSWRACRASRMVALLVHDGVLRQRHHDVRDCLGHGRFSLSLLGQTECTGGASR